MRGVKTLIDVVQEVLRFEERYYVERDDETNIIEKLLEHWKERPVVRLRGNRGEGKTWFLLYWLTRACNPAHEPLKDRDEPTKHPPPHKSPADVQNEKGQYDDNTKRGVAVSSRRSNQKAAQWVQFLSKHEVFVLLGEGLPIDKPALERLASCGIHVLIPPQRDWGYRLTEDDLRGWIAERLREILGMTVSPISPEGETQFSMLYHQTLEEHARKKKPLFIVDSIDVLELDVRELLERLYLMPVLDADGRVLLTLREGAYPPFKSQAITEAPQVRLPSLKADFQRWKRWVQRWVALRLKATAVEDRETAYKGFPESSTRRLGLETTAVEAPEAVWDALARCTLGSPFLVALAWVCAREGAGGADPQAIWEQLQRLAQEGSNGNGAPCSALRRCMRRWWIRLTFAPYAEEEGNIFHIPDRYTGQPVRLTEEDIEQLLVDLCEVAPEGRFEPMSWEPPLAGLSRWTVLSIFHAQGLVTWIQGSFYLDDTVHLLFAPEVPLERDEAGAASHSREDEP